MPNIENEVNFTTAQYPGLDNGENATYSEGLLVGYRYYNHHKITPKFAFGLGLSYTTFTYANLQISEDKYGGYRVTVEVANTGKVAGVETPQLYMEHPAAAGEPPKQLRGFQKIALAAGEARSVNFRLAARDFSIWDVNTHDWKASAGTFGVHVGASSEDIRASGQIKKTVCKKSEYCCPDAKHCLTPTATSCKADKNACAAGDVCCPITEICVTPGAACVSPCADQGSYCCPDALACLTPVAPGIFCGKGCGASQVCCPLTNMCVTAGAKCTPP